MCDFLSWIEKDGKNYFLTSADLASRRGKALRKHCRNEADLVGHGAIRWFYGEFTGGTDRECTVFSTPSNFPPEIAAAIKAGQFRGMGEPIGLLRPSAWAEYERIKQPAWAEYERIKQPACAEYERIQRAAWAAHERIQQPAWAAYERIQQPAFWDLFAIESNQADAWQFKV